MNPEMAALPAVEKRADSLKPTFPGLGRSDRNFKLNCADRVAQRAHRRVQDRRQRHRYRCAETQTPTPCGNAFHAGAIRSRPRYRLRTSRHRWLDRVKKRRPAARSSFLAAYVMLEDVALRELG